MSIRGLTWTMHFMQAFTSIMKGAVSVTFHLVLELKESYVDEIAFYVQEKCGSWVLPGT